LDDGIRLAQNRGKTERALPQFITEIDGVDIHFIHLRSKLFSEEVRAGFRSLR
jgi:hypothetical protein